MAAAGGGPSAEELLDEDEDAHGRNAGVRDGVERLVDDVHRRRRPRLGRGAGDAELDGVRRARRPLGEPGGPSQYDAQASRQASSLASMCASQTP